MNLHEAIRECKHYCHSINDCAEPRERALSRETELCVHSAREDVCANIDFAITVVLFATGCWEAGIVAALWTVAQFAEAVKWEAMLRTERAKMKLNGICREAK